MRWNKIPKRGLQLRMTMVFVTIACVAAVFQVFLINRALIEVAQALPNDGEVVLQQLPSVFKTSLLWTLLGLLPLMIGFGIVTTFRVAGPVFRMERYLESVASGDDDGPCAIRKRDELHDLCAKLNQAIDALRSQTQRESDEAQSDSDQQPTPQPERVTSDQSGFAIVIALITIVLLTATVISAVTQFQTHSTQVERRGEDYELESAVESATSLAMHELWTQFQRSVRAGTNSNTVDGFKAFLESIGCRDQSTATTVASFDLGARLGLDFDSDGKLELANTRVEELTMVRLDAPKSVEVRIKTTVAGRLRETSENAGGWLRTIETAFSLEPESWGGLEYVLLANNVNCALCHTTIDSVQRVYGNGSGPYERIKVGTLEHLLMRPNADSQIRGTLYAGGPITDRNGNTIQNWNSQTLRSVQLDGDGNVVEDASGNPVSSSMSPTDGSTDRNGNLYEDYGSTTMVDGELPATFPPPFPDDGGIDPTTGNPTPTAGGNNRRVDPNEFYAVTKDFTGTLSGGRISVIPPGTQISTEAALITAMDGSTTTSLSSVTQGQVFLTGTQSNPILLNGDVAIEGNLVIRGWVKGKGAIWATENVYAPVDLEYVDGTSGGQRTFGIAPDNSENLLVVTSGGNVLLGDPFQPFKAGTSSEGRLPSFAQMETSTFNRSEWAKTQPNLPGPRGMIANPNYIPGYVPRYYGMTDTEQFGVFNRGGGWFDAAGTWRGAEYPSSWDSSKMTFGDITNSLDPLLFDSSGNPKAHVSYMTAGNSWITDSMLSTMIDRSYAGRPNGELKLDIFAYTNNAIFGITSRTTRNTGARIRINGGVVAADVGLLATRGIELNYDHRVLDVLRISGGERVIVRRRYSMIER